MRIAEHELDAPETASCQLSQERRPDRFGLGRADLHAQNLAPAVGIDAEGDDHGDRDSAAIAANLQIRGVDPKMGHSPSIERAAPRRNHFG